MLRPSLTVSLAAVFWFGLFASSILSVMPYNTFTEKMRTIPSVHSLVPQGWGFFTRAPQEEDFYLYSQDQESWSNAFIGPTGRASNLFGWRRSARAQGVEYGTLLAQVSKGDFVSCQEDHISCLKSEMFSTSYPEIVNYSPKPTLCGKLGIIFQKPVPWAWFKENQQIEMPSRLIKVSVKC